MRRWAWVVMTGLALGVAWGQEALDVPLGLGEGGERFRLFGDRWASDDVDPAPAGVDEALDWLADQQHADGSWGDVEVTVHAVLAYLAVGHTPGFGAYEDEVAAGLKWIGTREDEQTRDGWFDRGDTVVDALAMSASAEFYAVTGKRILRGAVDRALTRKVDELRLVLDAGPSADVTDADVSLVTEILLALRWRDVRASAERSTSDVHAAIAWLDVNVILTPDPAIDPGVAASAAVAALLHDPIPKRLEVALDRFGAPSTDDPAYELARQTLLFQESDDAWDEGRAVFADHARDTQRAEGSWPAAHGHDELTSTALHVRALVAGRRFARFVPEPPTEAPWPPDRPERFVSLLLKRVDASESRAVARVLEAMADARGSATSRRDVVSTARTLLAVLQAGTTEFEGGHSEQVVDGYSALLELQHDDGLFVDGSAGAHALATLALVEFYGFTGRRIVREPMKLALWGTDAIVARAIVGPLDDVRGDDDALVVVGRILAAWAHQPTRYAVDRRLLGAAIAWIDRHLASRTTVADDRLGALACAVLGATLVDPDRERVERFFARHGSATSPPRDLDSIAHIASLRAQLVDLTTDPWFLEFGVPDVLDDLSFDELVDTVRIVTSPYRYASVLEPR